MIPFVAIFLLAGAGLVVAGRKLERAANRALNWTVTEEHLERCEVVAVPGTQVDDVSGWQLRLDCLGYALMAMRRNLQSRSSHEDSASE